MNDAQLLKANRKLWDAWKERRATAESRYAPVGLDGEDPRLGEALHRLVHIHDYSDTEIGFMFGVSRERVRQWRQCCDVPGRKRKTNLRQQIRAWSWELERFVEVEAPLRKYFKNGKASSLGHAKRLKKSHQAKLGKMQRRSQDVLKLQNWIRQHGRVPYAREWLLTLSKVNVVSARWGRQDKRGGTLTAGQAFDRLYTAAGYKNQRPDGRTKDHGKRWIK